MPYTPWVKVFCKTGESWRTDINATKEEAEAYFIGKVFNIGRVDDKMVVCERIEYHPLQQENPCPRQQHP